MKTASEFHCYLRKIIKMFFKCLAVKWQWGLYGPRSSRENDFHPPPQRQRRDESKLFLCVAIGKSALHCFAFILCQVKNRTVLIKEVNKS